MRYLALLLLIVSEGLWLPANLIGIGIIVVTAIVSLGLILKGWA